MNIKVDRNDIFDYVVGNTTVDPIERQIDFENRYEVFDEFIYDNVNRRVINQNKSYCQFSKQVSNLRKMVSLMKREAIIKECAKLGEMDIEVIL